MKTKKLLAAILAIAMILSTFGVTVFAADTLTVGAGGDYATIEEAVEAAADGDTIQLLEDASASAVLDGISIDLNTFTLTLDVPEKYGHTNIVNSGNQGSISNGTLVLNVTTGGTAYVGGDLTLSNITMDFEGNNQKAPLFYFHPKGSITIEDSKINIAGVNAAGGTFAGNDGNTDKLILRNSTITAKDVSSLTNNVYVVIDGSDVKLNNVSNGLREGKVEVSNNSSVEMTEVAYHAVTNCSLVAENSKISINDCKYYALNLKGGSSLENTVVEVTNSGTYDNRNPIKVAADITVDETSSITVDNQPVTEMGVAKVGNTYYTTLAKAADALTDGSTLTILKTTDETLTIEKSISDVTITAAEGVTVGGIFFETQKDAPTTGKQYANIVVENVDFVGSGLYFNCQRSYFVTVKGLTMQNCTFTGTSEENVVGNRLFDIGLDSPGSNQFHDIKIIDCTSTGGFQGIRLGALYGNTEISGCTITNAVHNSVTLRGNIDDEAVITVSGNTIKDGGERAFRMDRITDGAKVEFTDNTITNTGDDDGSNFRMPTGATAVENIEIVVENNTLNGESWFPAELIENMPVDNVITPNITVELRKTDDDRVYDIYLKANEGKVMNRVSTADLKFELTPDPENRTKVTYDVVAEAPLNVIPCVDAEHSEDEYHFSYNGEGAKDSGLVQYVKLGEVHFNGYGKLDFKVVDGLVHTATVKDNIVVDYDTTGGEGKGKLVIADVNEPDVDENNDNDAYLGEVELKKITQDLTVNINFNNALNANTKDKYKAVTVTISNGDLEEDEVRKNVTVENGKTATVEFKGLLTQNTAYTVTIEAPGYRTAKYTVNTQERNKTLNFWNNVKTTAAEMEDGNTDSKANKNFLAGDIVNDNDINIYDLSAVVSYFGEKEINEAEDGTTKASYVKYDLNRDGKIDSKDVAYVLVSWGN